MTIKVIITGPFSTGKTTLASKMLPTLLEKGLATAFISDVARDCPFPLNKGQDDNASIWLATTQISRELYAASERPDIILCDRGVPDILAHHLDLREQGKGKELEKIRPFLRSWCETYDLLLSTSVDSLIAPVADGLREADSLYREKLEIFAQSILAGLENVVPLPHDLITRASRATDAIVSRL